MEDAVGIQPQKKNQKDSVELYSSSENNASSQPEISKVATTPCINQQDRRNKIKYKNIQRQMMMIVYVHRSIHEYHDKGDKKTETRYSKTQERINTRHQLQKQTSGLGIQIIHTRCIKVIFTARRRACKYVTHNGHSVRLYISRATYHQIQFVFGSRVKVQEKIMREE